MLAPTRPSGVQGVFAPRHASRGYALGANTGVEVRPGDAWRSIDLRMSYDKGGFDRGTEDSETMDAKHKNIVINRSFILAMPYQMSNDAMQYCGVD